ncbi:MAG: hypothetical protein RLY58_1318 [Pseudomonadota bacterium]|jgi:hypothetical protein
MSRHRQAGLSLQPSETAVLHVASRIYAAYIQTGRVEAGQETTMIQRAIEEAYHMAVLVDRVVVSDDEMG